MVNLSTSSIMTILAADIFGNAAVGIATGVLTILILIFGEITPKTMASLEADKIAMKSAKNIYLLMMILTPVIWTVNKMSGGILRLLHVDPNKKTDVMTCLLYTSGIINLLPKIRSWQKCCSVIIHLTG